MNRHAEPAGGGRPVAGGDNVAALHGVHYSVDTKPVFHGLDIEIRRGQVTAIMGPSGTGKTTLLRLITGQIAPDADEVVVDGQNVPRLTRRELTENNRIKSARGLNCRFLREILMNLGGRYGAEAGQWTEKAIEADLMNGMWFSLGLDHALYGELLRRQGRQEQNRARNSARR